MPDASTTGSHAAADPPRHRPAAHAVQNRRRSECAYATAPGPSVPAPGPTVRARLWGPARVQPGRQGAGNGASRSRVLSRPEPGPLASRGVRGAAESSERSRGRGAPPGGDGADGGDASAQSGGGTDAWSRGKSLLRFTSLEQAESRPLLFDHRGDMSRRQPRGPHDPPGTRGPGHVFPGASRMDVTAKAAARHAACEGGLCPLQTETESRLRPCLPQGRE